MFPLSFRENMRTIKLTIEYDGTDFHGWQTQLENQRTVQSEIEAALQANPVVLASCVVGIPDKKVGERIKAFVVLKDDVKGITGYDLTKWCRNRLAPYKIPEYIEFRDMLPKSKVGKVLRRELKDEEQRRVET
jgi:long-chain acyl-CoA synthetase